MVLWKYKEILYNTKKSRRKTKKFKSEINEIVTGSKKSEDQKIQQILLKHFINQEKKLSNYLMIILELYLKLNTEQYQEKRLKILSPKQMLQRFPIALAQVKAVNSSENLLNEIGQIIYSLFPEKEITKKVYNNLMNLIKL